MHIVKELYNIPFTEMCNERTCDTFGWDVKQLIVVFRNVCFYEITHIKKVPVKRKKVADIQDAGFDSNDEDYARDVTDDNRALTHQNPVCS